MVRRVCYMDIKPMNMRISGMEVSVPHFEGECENGVKWIQLNNQELYGLQVVGRGDR